MRYSLPELSHLSTRKKSLKNLNGDSNLLQFVYVNSLYYFKFQFRFPKRQEVG